MEKSKWSKELPTENGYYWFYGKVFCYEEENRLTIIRVRKVSNGFIYFYGSGGINEKELRGRFQRIKEPSI